MNTIYKMCIMISAIIFGDQVTKALVQQEFKLHESKVIIENLFIQNNILFANSDEKLKKIFNEIEFLNSLSNTCS